MRISVLPGLLSLAAIYSSSLAVASELPPDFDQLMQQVRGALLRFDLDSARAMLNRACHENTPVKTAVCETEAGVVDALARHGDDAECHYRRGLAIWAQLAPNYAASRATALMNLGDLYRTQRRMAEAEKALTEAFALAQEQAHSEGGPRLLASVSSRLGSTLATFNLYSSAR